MKLSIFFIGLLFLFKVTNAQELKLKPRNTDAMGGKAFALSISDSTLTLEKREEIIFTEIKSGNVPNYLRKLTAISDSIEQNPHQAIFVTYYVLPDYFAIGSDADFFYVPMTPILAQRVADLLKCSLPTKKMVDQIYKNASIKLEPKPIPPTKAMTTVPIFIVHNDSLRIQLQPFIKRHNNSELTAGNKKDIIISNKIYTEQTSKVVIYGWHKLDGKPIQPVYNKHTNLWADYSHGIRLIQNKISITVDHKKKYSRVNKVLASKTESYLLSNEGVIKKAHYPITGYTLAN